MHANVLNTLLTGDFLKPVPDWAIAGALGGSHAVHRGGDTVCRPADDRIVRRGAARHPRGDASAVPPGLAAFHVADDAGLFVGAGGRHRFPLRHGEKKSKFFRSAVALFVGKEVATSLEKTQKISLLGERRLVTILFTDIRGFTAFCESKDPAVVVDLLNVYMSKMVAIIVKYNGHVNKFIGDGILAVFSDDDTGAQPGDHALRTVKAATEMVSEVVGEFRTGAGIHSGEVVIGNVGSSDKLEFTVLGNTVNLASRLESLNKDQIRDY